MSVNVYEQADGKYKAMSAKQGRMVTVVVMSDGYIDPTKNRGAEFAGMEAVIHPYIPPEPAPEPIPAMDVEKEIADLWYAVMMGGDI
jgi:hypothetical protein